MVLTIKDHCASKAALAYFLVFHKDARFVKVRVLVALFNDHPFFAYLSSSTIALSMDVFFSR
jgi:hypothetical protein